MNNLLDITAYNYNLPEELIAQVPLPNRDDSRLMIVNRESGSIIHTIFRQIPEIFNAENILVFNNTKVIPARLLGNKNGTGAKIELLLTEKINDKVWKVILKPGKRVKVGSIIFFNSTFKCTIIENLCNGEWIAEFNCQGSFEHNLAQYGIMPLPPYIKRNTSHDALRQLDLQRYQTIFAKNSGSIAAPTAGLHFTENILQGLHSKNVTCESITLHVGLGTFAPVRVAHINDHKMHCETFYISEEIALRLQQAKQANKKITAIGTTTTRALESSIELNGKIKTGLQSTSIFMYPGYTFQCTDQLLTNFHLPQSTLLMLVCAFAGYDLMMQAYHAAVAERYRFFSYGDCMLIL